MPVATLPIVGPVAIVAATSPALVPATWIITSGSASVDKRPAVTAVVVTPEVTSVVLISVVPAGVMSVTGRRV